MKQWISNQVSERFSVGMDCYVVSLDNNGRREIFLVGKEYWNWINDKSAQPPSKLVDAFTTSSSEFDTKEQILEYLNGGEDWVNERAACLCWDLDVKRFWNLKSYTDFVREYKVNVEDELDLKQ